MILLYVLLFFVTLALYLWGGLNQILAFLFMGAALLAILYYFVRFLVNRVRLLNFKRTVKATWLGRFIHLAGLPLFPEQQLYIYLKEDDNLYFESYGWEAVYHEDDVKRITVIAKNRWRDALAQPTIEAFGIKGTPYERNFFGAIQVAREADYPGILVLNLCKEEGKPQWLFLAFRHGKGKMQKFWKRPGLRQKLRPLRLKAHSDQP